MADADLPSARDDSRESVGAVVPWVYFSRLSLALSAGLFYLYIARVLPQNEVGSVVVVGAIAAVSSALFSLGLGFGLRHFLSYYIGAAESRPVSKLTGGAYLVATLLAAAAVVTTLGLSTFVTGLFFHSPENRPEIGLLALYIGLGTASWILRSVLLGLQRFVAYSTISGSGHLTSYALATFLLLLWGGINSILLGWVLGYALACALFLIAIRTQHPLERRAGAEASHGLPPTRSLYWTVLIYSLPLFVAFLVSTGASYVDRLILASLASLSSVAVYNYAVLISTTSLYVVAPLGTVLLPKISEAFGRGDSAKIRQVTRTASTLVVLVYVPVGLATAALAPFLIDVLVGSSFESAAYPLALLVGISAASIPYVALTGLAAGIRRTTPVVAAAGLALGSNVALCWLLVPGLGMIGAAIGNAALPSATFLALFFWLRPTRLVEFDGRSIGCIWMASAAMAVTIAVPCMLVSYRAPLVGLSVGAGLVILLALLRVTRAIPPDSHRVLLRMTHRRLQFVRPLVNWVAGSGSRSA